MQDFLTLKLGQTLAMKMELMSYSNEIQAHLNDCYIEELNVNLTDTWVLRFSCPYYVTDEITKQSRINRNYDLVKEEKLIRLKCNNSYAVFVIKEINETDDGIKEIIAYSREKMLDKEVVLDKETMQLKSDEVETGKGIFDILHENIRGWSLAHLDTNAKIETIEGIRANKYRYFDSVQMDWINFLREGVNTAFDTLLLFDTYNRKIYCYDYKSYGNDTGFNISRKNIASQLSKSTDTKELVTKLYPTGKEGLNIINSCPYGAYVINYDYFKPQMSKELQAALNLYEQEIAILFTQWNDKNALIIPLSRLLDDLKNQQSQLEKRVKDKKSEQALIIKGGNAADINRVATELANLNSQLTNVNAQITTKQTDIDNKRKELYAISDSMQIEVITHNSVKIFNDSTLDELDAYTHPKRISNETHFKSDSLYQWGLDTIKDLSKPPMEFTINSDDFLDNEDYEDFNQEISLGDWFNVVDDRFGKDKVRLLGYSYKPSSSSLNLSFTNKDKREEWKGLSGAIEKFNKTDRTFNLKKINWDLVSQEKDFVKGIRENGLNTALAEIFSENNQNKIEITQDGIWIQDASNPNKIIVITSSVIVISNDGLKTASACITPDGLIGDTIIGKILASEKLYISNKNNNFIIDQNGITADVNKFLLKTSNGNKTVTGLIDVSANGLRTEFQNADTGLSSSISQTASQLRTEFKNADSSLSSSITQTASQIRTDVSNNYATKSSLTQTANSIRSEISNLEDDTYSEIRQLSNEISSKVSEGQVSSIIRQSPSAVEYAFNDISSSVTIDRYGLKVHNGSISADVIDGGTIRGVEIRGSDYYAGNVTSENLTSKGEVYFYQGCTIQDDLLVKGDHAGFNNNATVNGNFRVYGDKQCVQRTENYGNRGFYAYETGESYLGDLGFGQLINGRCKVELDPIIKESINTDSYYHVFISKYDQGDIWVQECNKDYFIVKGNNDMRFSWEIKGKRRGHEGKRLELVKMPELKVLGGDM